MRRALIALALVVLVPGSATSPAGADGKLDGYKHTEQSVDGNVTVVAGRDGSVTQPEQAAGGTLDCRIHDLRPDTTQLAIGDEATGLEEGIGYWLLCDDAAGNRVVSRLFTYEPGVAAISAEQLAQRARDQLRLLHPEPRTSPAIALRQIVGIDTWMWLDPGSWEPITATASIPGLSVSAEATPVAVRWDMGDGTVVSCDGPGTPYDDSLPEAAQWTGCSHVYQSRGDYTASVTVTWSIGWSASDGDGGRLAGASRTTGFPMTVIERQSIGW